MKCPLTSSISHHTLCCLQPFHRSLHISSALCLFMLFVSQCTKRHITLWQARTKAELKVSNLKVWASTSVLQQKELSMISTPRVKTSRLHTPAQRLQNRSWICVPLLRRCYLRFHSSPSHFHSPHQDSRSAARLAGARLVNIPIYPLAAFVQSVAL